MGGESYRRLNYEEREEISRGLACGLTIGEIALITKRNKSTISREVRKGSCNRWTYRAVRAEKRARRKASKRRLGKRKIYRNAKLRNLVHRLLRLRWSPEQIAQRLRFEYPTSIDMKISAESIYMYVYVMPKGRLKDELVRELRRKHRRRRKKSGEKRHTIRQLEDMISIEDRPKEVESREIPGHWEGDLLIGKNRQSAIGTLVERKTRLLKLVKLKDKSAEEVKDRFAAALKGLPRQFRLSLTYDQGREMAAHKKLSQEAKIKVYFAHKASPWERGTCENTNGLIRQFFPKGTDFNKVNWQKLRHAERLMNGRPRKTLGWKTPEEAFAESVALNS